MLLLLLLLLYYWQSSQKSTCFTSILVNSVIMPHMPQSNRTTFLNASGYTGANLTTHCQVVDNLSIFTISPPTWELETFPNFPNFPKHRSSLSLPNQVQTILVFISGLGSGTRQGGYFSKFCNIVFGKVLDKSSIIRRVSKIWSRTNVRNCHFCRSCIRISPDCQASTIWV